MLPHEIFISGNPNDLETEDHINLNLQFARIQYQSGNIAKVKETLDNLETIISKLDKKSDKDYLLGQSYFEMGFLYLKVEEFINAKTCFMNALEYQNLPEKAKCYFYLSEVYANLKQDNRANKKLEETWEILSEFLDKDSPFIGLIYSKLAHADIKTQLDDDTAAEVLSLGEDALKIQIQSFKMNHPYVVESCNTLAEMNICVGDFATAFKYLKMAWKICEQSLERDYRLKIKILELMGQIYVKCHHYHQAIVFYQETLDLTKKFFENDEKQIGRLKNLILSVESINKIEEKREEKKINEKRCAVPLKI